MKRARIATLLLAILLGLALLLPACGAAKELSDYDLQAVVSGADDGAIGRDIAEDQKAEYDENGGVKAPAAPTPGAPEDPTRAAGEATDAAAGRKLIKNVNATIETEKFDACVKQLEVKAKAVGGYVESFKSTEYGYFEEPLHTATLCLRIPAARLEEYKAALGKQGKVTELGESVSDVTMEYTDIQAHIKALQTERETLLGILKTAENLTDVLAVQDRLTNVNYQLDSLESRIRVLNSQIELSEVTLTVTELAPRKYDAPKGFWATVWSDIKDNTANIGEGAKSFAGWFLGFLPVLLLIAAIVTAVVLLLRLALRKRKKNKMK